VCGEYDNRRIDLDEFRQGADFANIHYGGEVYKVGPPRLTERPSSNLPKALNLLHHLSQTQRWSQIHPPRAHSYSLRHCRYLRSGFQ
jgi:hypothetical protein